MSLTNHLLHIRKTDRDGVVPQLLKLAFAVSHVVVVLHRHIEFVAGRLSGAETLFGEVAAAHDDPAVAVLVVLPRQAEVEFGVEVLGRMDAQLQATAGNIVTKLTDALVHLAAIVRLPHITQKILAVLFQRFVTVAEEHLASGLCLMKHIVDIDTDKDFDFLCGRQFLKQFEVAAGTEIANHGVEDVEVGHRGGDAVELVHQR